METIENELNIIASEINSFSPISEVDKANKAELVLAGLKAKNYLSLKDMLVRFYKFTNPQLLNQETISLYEQITKENEEINTFIQNNLVNG